MEGARLSGLNLNLLVALDALLAERNVTRAARRIGVTQPALSQTLARLRELFGDPLLVRDGRATKLTPRAAAMVGPLADALASVERAIQLGMAFDPATSTRIFRIALADLELTILLPHVLRVVRQVAPRVRVQAVPVSMHGLPERLASGDVDVAIAVHVRGTESLRSTELYADELVCIVRRGHPLARRSRIRLEEYREHGHIAYTPVGYVPESMSAVAPGMASGAGIVTTVPYLLAIPFIARHTDLVATVPRRLLEAPIDRTGLVVREAPSELPPIVDTLYWHPRFDDDPGHRWLRAKIVEARNASRGDTTSGSSSARRSSTAADHVRTARSGLT